MSFGAVKRSTRHQKIYYAVVTKLYCLETDELLCGVVSRVATRVCSHIHTPHSLKSNQLIDEYCFDVCKVIEINRYAAVCWLLLSFFRFAMPIAISVLRLPTMLSVSKCVFL